MHIINDRRKRVPFKKLMILIKPFLKPYTFKSLYEHKLGLTGYISDFPTPLKKYKKQCHWN